MTWDDLAGYVRSNYQIADDQPGFMKIIFTTHENRLQSVFLFRHVLGEGEQTEEWLQIASPIAELKTADLPKILELLGDVVCGGAAAIADYVMVRHSVPLANLDLNEFEHPLALVTATADRLEHVLHDGEDQF